MAINQVSWSNVTVWKSQLAPSSSGLIKVTSDARMAMPRPAPISRAHMPARNTTAAPASAGNNRNVHGEMPKMLVLSHASIGVTGG